MDFNGEAYFNVAKNKSVPFVITTKDLTVRVLGTKFNLHAYAGNETMEVTLEEGEILVSSRKEEKKLLPNQKAVLNCQNDLLNALEILKYSYHMDYCVDAKDIYFSKK